MTVILTAREFNQSASKALITAETQPVFITKRGKITNVVLNYHEFLQTTQKNQTFAEIFGDFYPEQDFAFEFERDKALVTPMEFN